MQDVLLDVAIEEAGYEPGNPKVGQILFQIRSGGLTGLIGPNGAGKSTTIKAVLGLLPEVKGSITFSEIKGRGGTYAYIPEQPVYYDTLTLWEHLSLAAAVYEMDEGELESAGNRLLEKFRMSDARNLLPGGFSKGMKQKMMLMIGFLRKPDVYIVDEPFVGLDPRATHDFLELLEEERERGAGILLCTHVLDTAERICSDFLMISEGSLAASGTMEELALKAGMPGGTLFECFDRLT
ncbi:multidrug ABC transporter ATP-binding protein [Paenibacillus antibioticophila]|uniref:Multidrug ABC transporter ATP-binding protein n=1 Tax=Paenibacillus antibioticophila TaxID=1274374 RepID=A0A920CFP4_9BACL|nr:ABC transporter ATP-binding protein [Paenibacillus antibioticophila]GIO37870.1 multidrug ABC transporter ATP-binding protein [Paenibacillus antibioticophila]